MDDRNADSLPRVGVLCFDPLRRMPSECWRGSGRIGLLRGNHLRPLATGTSVPNRLSALALTTVSLGRGRPTTGQKRGLRLKPDIHS